MSYGALDARANRYAHWALAQGMKRGDCVALLMENRPDYLCCLAWPVQGGRCSVALINTNQRGQALAHSIAIAGARHAIVGAELAACVTEAEPFFTAPPLCWVEGGAHAGDAGSGRGAGKHAHRAARQGARAGVTAKDRAFFIYTSGTTGLPKAANFSHMRMLFMM